MSVFNTFYFAFRTTEAMCHEYLKDQEIANIVMFAISRFLTDYVNILVTIYIFRPKKNRKSDESFKDVGMDHISRLMSEENIWRPASPVSRASFEDSEMSDLGNRKDV